ncbi:DUF2087 domain-containing protein [Streptomyces sp. NRRL S-350]|uniref:DUF2087 domain-containing protein n=1 Tax=Streptomyces sp. NRRL S-350 TaxID=1463902 RepID=UPI0006902887|nr:DUF2087 domain-containing protein [Streptomyces sp. NRRL S-350]
MTAAGPTSPSGSALFAPDGRLIAVPRKAARREQLLAHLADTLFEPGRGCTEAEVNAALHTVHDDAPALRRSLVEAGHLARPMDGSSYRLASERR